MLHVCSSAHNQRQRGAEAVGGVRAGQGAAAPCAQAVMSELNVTVLGRHFSASMMSNARSAMLQLPAFSHALIRLEYVITEHSQPVLRISAYVHSTCAVRPRPQADA